MLRLVLVALGVAMVLAAIAWRARDLRRRSSGVEGALRSSDPFTRTRALREIASVGLRPWAAMLLERTNEVGDGVEADELVWLVGACQWEPADDPAIVQLRLWAARRLERRPLATSEEPVETSVPVVEPVAPPVEVVAPAVDTSPAEVFVRPVEAVAPPADAPPAEARPAVVDEIERIVGSRVLSLTFVPLAQGGS